MSKHLKKGDRVLVRTGNDKGRTGEVIGFRKGRVLVGGVNVRRKHVKKTAQQQQQIIDMEQPVDASNLAICDADGRPLKLKVRVSAEKKELIYSQDGQEKVYRTIR